MNIHRKHSPDFSEIFKKYLLEISENLLSTFTKFDFFPSQLSSVMLQSRKLEFPKELFLD